MTFLNKLECSKKCLQKQNIIEKPLDLFLHSEFKMSTRDGSAQVWYHCLAVDTQMFTLSYQCSFQDLIKFKINSDGLNIKL